MRKIDVKKLFTRLVSSEYAILKYLKTENGEAPFELSYTEIAAALGTDKKEVSRACRRLILCEILQGESGKFRIDTGIFKSQ